MDAMQLLVWINVVAVLVSGIIRTGMNVDGTGWFDRLFKSSSRKPKHSLHAHIKSNVVYGRTYRRSTPNASEEAHEEHHQVAKG